MEFQCSGVWCYGMGFGRPVMWFRCSGYVVPVFRFRYGVPVFRYGVFVFRYGVPVFRYGFLCSGIREYMWIVDRVATPPGSRDLTGIPHTDWGFDVSSL